MRSNHGWHWLKWGLGILVALALWGCQAIAPPPDGLYQRQSPSQDGIGKMYLGREIAQVMGHEGAYWLERPSRELQERPQTLVDLLELSPEAVVADIGAGTGYLTVRMAQQVSSGQVWAVDVQPEMLALLRDRLTETEITNIQLVQGSTEDPHLPPEQIDLALLVDAYHEFEFPYEMMTRLKDALKPGGRVVLAEYRAENPLVLIKRLHKMSEKQVKREMQAVGLHWLKTEESLPQQHLLFFEKPAIANFPAQNNSVRSASEASETQNSS